MSEQRTEYRTPMERGAAINLAITVLEWLLSKLVGVPGMLPADLDRAIEALRRIDDD